MRISTVLTKTLALVLVFAICFTTLATPTFAIGTNEPEAQLAAENLVSKLAYYNEADDNYTIKLKVPGEDGENLHDEVILMVDGSYSGDNEWPSMKKAIIEIGRTVLNGTGNTQLTLMAFGMAANDVLVHIKSADALEKALGELPGYLLYGRSSTNNEVGFTAVADYIRNHDDTLHKAHVLYISDGEVNTDETPVCFDDWQNRPWYHRYNNTFVGQYTMNQEYSAIKQGANRSDAFNAIFGEGDLETLFANATNEQRLAYIDRIYQDVFADAGLDITKEYPVSVAELAFADYDNKHNTYVQDAFYVALLGRSYPNQRARAVAAAEALAAMEQVETLYIIDSNKVTVRSDWMLDIGNAKFIEALSIANLIPALSEALTNLAKTPFNDVVVTDYMSKWVNLDLASIAIVNDRTGQVIWSTEAGWQIDTGRPTSQEVPVVVELVDAKDYAAGGPEVVGNVSGDIYRLTWYVKDGAMLRSENYHLEYRVTMDTQEEGFLYNVDHPANGLTAVSYLDENGQPCGEEIAVPEIIRYNYELLYNANFGENATQLDSESLLNTQEASHLIHVDGNMFDRPHYDFKGWAETPDGAVVYGKDDVISFTEGGSKTLYAIWEEHPKYSYEIIYDSNFGDRTTANDSQNLFNTYDTSRNFDVDGNMFDRPHYDFKGWAETPDGAVVYGKDDVISFTEGGRKTLYAIWKEHPRYSYEVIYSANFGQHPAISYDEQNAYRIFSTTYYIAVDALMFTRPDYNFLGWATAPEGEVVYKVGDIIGFGTSGRKVLYAIWEKVPAIPTEPTVPTTEPTIPTEPTAPTTEPTIPTEPTAPATKPTIPTKPTKPTDPDYEHIPDDEIPLAPPDTGDPTALLACLAVLSGTGTAMMLRIRKKDDEEDEI